MLVSSVLAGLQSTLAAVHSATAVPGFLAELSRERTRLEKMFAEWRSQHELAEEMLVAIGWPFPGHLSAAGFDEIINAYHGGELSGQDVESIIAESYTERRLSEIVRGWEENERIQHRLPVLREAVTAHIEGRFQLSIPAILPQIEGVIAEAFAHTGRIDLPKVKAYVEIVFPSSSLYYRSAGGFFIRVLFEKFFWGDPIPGFSRHAILHGADTSYASVSNSLRAIIFFDLLQSSVGYVCSSAGSRVHLATCHRIAGKTLRKTYGRLYDAEADGLVPCKACLPQSVGGEPSP